MATQEWAPIIAALTAGESLDYDQSYWLMDQVMSGELGEARLASFLTAMAMKGATVDEIHGLADGMQDHAARVDLPSRALDIVGTGGDGAKTFNISTAAMFVTAAAGAKVAKHGGRSVSSSSTTTSSPTCRSSTTSPLQRARFTGGAPKRQRSAE